VYIKKTTIEGMPKNGFSYLVIPLVALLSTVSAYQLFQPWWMVLMASIILLIILLLITRQIKKTDRQLIKRVTESEGNPVSCFFDLNDVTPQAAIITCISNLINCNKCSSLKLMPA
jgi:uncharacterized membrane protein